MKTLPDEVWQLIFEYVNGSDIIRLTKVCKSFHEIVNRTQSLSSKLTLCFEKHKRYNRMGRRKYTNLTVEYMDQAIHYNILRFIGSDITQLTFKYYSFKLESIRQVLMLCVNVKVLTFEEIKHVHGVQEVGDATQLPEYKNIEINLIKCDPRIFKILKKCQVRKVKVSCCEFAHRHYFLHFMEFLKAQENLQHLCLMEFIGPCVGIGLVLFQNDKLSDVKFRLKSLELKDNELIPYGNISSVLFFELFMDQHKETLEVLDADRLRDFDFSDYSKQCKSLRKLTINIDTKFSSKNVLLNVQQLEIDHTRVHLIKCFPNVREIKIISAWHDENGDVIKWNLLTKCKYLERLDIEDLSLDDFPSLPSLKSLKLGFFVSIDSEIFNRNPQIEELTFIECKDMRSRKSKVLKIIIDYLNDLKSLTIASTSKVDPAAIEYVKKKCTNLKYLKLFKDIDCERFWV